MIEIAKAMTKVYLEIMHVEASKSLVCLVWGMMSLIPALVPLLWRLISGPGPSVGLAPDERAEKPINLEEPIGLDP